MIDKQLLERQNPWWQNPDNIDQDEKIVEVEKVKFRYEPSSVLSLPEIPKAVHIISGPRQTGKSTALKLKIKNLLRKGISPSSIFYYNCDSLESRQDIIDLIVSYLELQPKGITYLFLDEISSVKDWPYGIKWLADAGLFKSAVIYLTGSSSINIKKSGEFLPGRRGAGKNVHFLPLSFFQVLEIKKFPVKKIPFASKNLQKELKTLELYHSRSFIPEFNRFLSTGGFIKLINDPLNSSYHRIYQESLRSEIVKNGKSEKNMRAVLKKLIDSLSSETSYTNIAEEAELGSKNTACDYLEFLIDSFFLHESLFFDISQKKYILKKNKKYHFIDPYIVWLLWGYYTGAGVSLTGENNNFINADFFIFASNSGPMIENFVASELFKKQKEFYFSKNSRELDFYLPKENLGIEVKYKDKIVNEDIKTLSLVKRKILVSKNTLEARSDILIIPAYLFSLLEF